MRTRFLSFIIVFFVFVSAESLFGRKSELPALLSPRQQVDSEMANLEKNIRAAKSLEVRWRFLENSRMRIRSLRAKNSRQFEKDELYMDYLVFSLDDFANKADFRLDQCEVYRSRVISRFNPQYEVSPHPAIVKTLAVLQSLCR